MSCSPSHLLRATEMARQYAVDDSEWEEVKLINGYALFMGYLMMGVRGLGLLVITWTTVVLLGGFVSDLGKKDFWCLTGITLIQTAGVFNFLLKEKISDTVHSWWGILITVLATFCKDDGEEVGTRGLIIAFVLVAIQVLVFGVILCALGVVYMLGMYISAGVSLCRLIEHDFGNAGGDNQWPALEVLYIIAVAQGVLFGYKTIYALVTGRSRLGNVVAGVFTDADKGLIEEYIEETVAGCEKNVSFASGRNLVTYGVNLIKEAKSNEGFIAGIKVLGGGINYKPALGLRRANGAGRKVLAKYLLITSDSSSAIIERLLETVGPRSPYSREIKEHVVRILDIIAPCIRLEQFPRAIECLCSVVDTSSEESNNKLQWNRADMVTEFEGTGDGDKIEDIYTYAILKKYKDARCEKIKDYERVELLEEYEKEYINDEPIARSKKLLFRLQRRLYRCLPCAPLVQHCFLVKRKPEENKKQENILWASDQLLLKTVNIIHKLVADEDNRWILRTCVSNKVLHKIAKLPIKLRRESHDPFGVHELLPPQLQMLEQCWELTEWLLVALTETSSPPLLPAATPVGEGPQRRRSEEIIEEEVEEGEEQLLLLRSMVGSAIQILLHLSFDMSVIIKDRESSRRRLSWILLLIFCSKKDDLRMVPSLTCRNKNCCDFDGIRRKAGEKLSEMLREKHELPLEESARELQSIRLALGDLISASCADAEDISIRTHAIIIMQGLCLCRFDDTRFSKQVEEFLVGAIPEVVMETLTLCGSKTAERQEQATDLEKGKVSQDNQDGCTDTERLRKALASLCYFGYDNYSNSTRRSKFKAIASKTCEEQGKSFDDFMCLLCQSITQ